MASKAELEQRELGIVEIYRLSQDELDPLDIEKKIAEKFDVLRETAKCWVDLAFDRLEKLNGGADPGTFGRLRQMAFNDRKAARDNGDWSTAHKCTTTLIRLHGLDKQKLEIEHKNLQTAEERRAEIRKLIAVCSHLETTDGGE